MTTGKAVLLVALFGAMILLKGLHVTVRVSPIGNVGLVSFFDRTVIDFATGEAAIAHVDETPAEPDAAGDASATDI